jgi:RNA polymerase sigma factor (sigma-70 family)
VELSLRTRVRAGEKDAFGLLFEEHARAVYNHAFRLTGNWSTAEEVVSLTFLEAWRRRGTIRAEGGSLLPWLLVIALNVTRNISRAARRHQAAMSRLPLRADEPDFADELADRIDDATRLEAVRTALSRLRRGERDVLALCVWSLPTNPSALLNWLKSQRNTPTTVRSRRYSKRSGKTSCRPRWPRRSTA